MNKIKTFEEKKELEIKGWNMPLIKVQTTYVTKVQHGWVMESVIEIYERRNNSSALSASSSQVFISDINHEWKFEEVK